MEPNDLLPPPGFLQFSGLVLRRHWLKVFGVPFVIESFVGVLIFVVGLWSEQAAANLWSWVLRHPLVVLSPSFLICVWLFACESYREHQTRLRDSIKKKKGIRDHAEELLLALGERNGHIERLSAEISDLQDRLKKAPGLAVEFDAAKHTARDTAPGSVGGVARIAVANTGNASAHNVVLKIVGVEHDESGEQGKFTFLDGLLLSIATLPNGGRAEDATEAPKDRADVFPGFPLVFDAVSLSPQPGNHRIYHSTTVARDLSFGQNRNQRVFNRKPDGVLPSGEYTLTVIAISDECRSLPRSFVFGGTQSDVYFIPAELADQQPRIHLRFDEVRDMRWQENGNHLSVFVRVYNKSPIMSAEDVSVTVHVKSLDGREESIYDANGMCGKPLRLSADMTNTREPAQVHQIHPLSELEFVLLHAAKNSNMISMVHAQTTKMLFDNQVANEERWACVRPSSMGYGRYLITVIVRGKNIREDEMRFIVDQNHADGLIFEREPLHTVLPSIRVSL